jgi:hypothetical protein
MLEPIFGNASAEKALFYLRLNGQGYAKAMAAKLGCALTPLQAQLKRLERGGLLASRALGRTRLYQLNPAYFYAPELLALLDKALAAMPAEQKARFEARLRPRRAGKP